VRTLNDRGLVTKRGIEVICWTNEEGARFSPPMMGSMAFAKVLTIDFRHIDPDRFQVMRTEIDTEIAAAAKKANVGIEVAEGWSWGTDLFAPECIELLKSTAAELGLPYREMRSQAGHDAYAVATMAPTAMIFTPCFEGISHNVNEAIELTRSVPGANLLLNAAVARANR
jgi:N-carbamoyl-L-amino-acid hydrolase